MTTLTTAIQTLVNNLQTKMTSNAPLTPEEQTLVATAIDKLSSHATLEEALVAVASEHLGNATTALSDAKTDISDAKAVIEAQAANLTQIPQMNSQIATSLAEFTAKNTNMIDHKLAGMTRPVFGINHIEVTNNSGNNARSQACFAVYDANGESYIVRPSYTNGTNNYESQRFEYLSLPASGSGKQTLATHYVHSGTFYATPTSHMFRYGATATLPLALKDDADDIAYDLVYSSQSAANSNVADYAGVFTREAGAVTITKPKQNVDANDKWNIGTLTNHNWHEVGVLYDNAKHCMVMVEHGTSLLVEKYRDGNVVTDIEIADSAALQAYVDNGNFTTVRFIANYMSWPQMHDRYRTGITNTSVGYYHDMFGFFGKVGDDIRMGTGNFSVHYIYTEDGELQPVNYVTTSSVNGNTTNNGSLSDVYVSMVAMDDKVLGVYHFQSKTDHATYNAGYVANSIMCINPFSHTGILNEHYAWNSTTAYYGVGRTCKAF